MSVDGLSFGAHAESDINTIFFNYVSGESVHVNNMVVTSGIIGGARFLRMGASAGRLTFSNSILAGSWPLASDDLFDPRVTFINCAVGGRTFGHATGLFDLVKPQPVTYSASDASAPNNRLYSRTMLISPSSAGSNRTITGSPAFATGNVPDYENVTLVNAGTGNLVIFSESQAATGIVLLAGATSLALGPNESIRLVKQPNGKLVQA